MDRRLSVRAMRVMEFQVCQRRARGRATRRVVMLGDSVYGAYLDKEQALLDAVDAARDALQSGRKARVWLKDRSNAACVFEVERQEPGGFIRAVKSRVARASRSCWSAQPMEGKASSFHGISSHLKSLTSRLSNPAWMASSRSRAR